MSDGTRVLIALPDELRAAIKTWRHRHEIATESAAIRELIRLGLEAKPAPKKKAGKRGLIRRAARGIGAAKAR